MHSYHPELQGAGSLISDISELQKHIDRKERAARRAEKARKAMEGQKENESQDAQDWHLTSLRSFKHVSKMKLKFSENKLLSNFRTCRIQRNIDLFWVGWKLYFIHSLTLFT